MKACRLSHLVGLVALGVTTITQAGTLTVNSSDGTLSANAGAYGNSVTFNGTSISRGTLVGNVQEYLVFGDLNLLNGDLLTATNDSAYAIRFRVAGNANIAAGATVDVSGLGQIRRAAAVVAAALREAEVVKAGPAARAEQGEAAVTAEVVPAERSPSSVRC